MPNQAPQRLVALCLAALIALAGRPAFATIMTAQSAANPTRTAQDPEIHGDAGLAEVTVEAQRKALEKRVRGFVDRLTHSIRFSPESVPRWQAPLCFMVAGLPRAQSAFVAARLTHLAVAAGAPTRQHGCTRKDVNFYVVFTPDRARTLKYLDVHPRLLFQSDASRSQMERFLSPAGPGAVRVWHNASFVGSDRKPLVAGDSACLSMPRMPVNCAADGGSRVTLAAVQDFTEALVVVDSNRIAGITLQQLSDYIGMVGLADFALEDNFGDSPTILQLFTRAAESRPEEITDWDRAFLHALYHTSQRSVTQRESIAVSMVSDLVN